MVQTSCDRDDSKNHPLIRNFRGTSYYEDRGPVKPRKDFSCSACEKNIPLGTDVKFTIRPTDVMVIGPVLKSVVPACFCLKS